MNQNTTDIDLCIIIDGDYLDFVTKDMKSFFDEKTDATTQPIELAQFAYYVSTLNNIEGSDNQIVVMMALCDSKLFSAFTTPDIEKNYSQASYQTDAGIIEFFVGKSENMAPSEEFTLDLLSVAVSQQNIKRICVIADSSMKEDVEEISRQKGNVKLLTINPSQIAEDTNPEDSLAYPIMLSLNVGD